MEKKNITILIIIILIFSAILAALLFLAPRRNDINNNSNINNSNNNNNDYDNQEPLEDYYMSDEEYEANLDEEEILHKYHKINDHSEYITANNIVKEYITSNYSNQTIKLLSILDQNYIIENEITSENVINANYQERNINNFITTNLELYNNGTIKTYIIEGNLSRVDMDLTSREEKVIFIVRIDTKTSSYSIEPTTSNIFSSVKLETDVNDTTTINRNTYNKYELEILPNDNIPFVYMYDFTAKVASFPELAYEHLIKDEEYNTYEEFTNFRNKYINELVDYTTDKINLTIENDQLIYKIQTSHYTYTFYTTSVLEYTVEIS